jgi:hypothetical protein
MLKKARKKKAQNGARPENGGLQLKASGSNTAVTVDAKSPLFPAPLFSSAGSELPSRRHRNWQLLPDKPAATASKTASSGKAVGGAGGALLKKGAQPQGERPRTAPTVLGKRGRASAARPRPSALDFGAATGAAGSASAGASTPGGALCSVENGEGGEGDDDAGIMAEYEWARKNHERHQQAAFMQVVVKSFMTEATLLDVLLPIDTSVRGALCALFALLSVESKPRNCHNTSDKRHTNSTFFVCIRRILLFENSLVLMFNSVVPSYSHYHLHVCFLHSGAKFEVETSRRTEDYPTFSGARRRRGRRRR